MLVDDAHATTWERTCAPPLYQQHDIPRVSMQVIRMTVGKGTALATAEREGHVGDMHVFTVVRHMNATGRPGDGLHHLADSTRMLYLFSRLPSSKKTYKGGWSEGPEGRRSFPPSLPAHT